ncbi:MAG: hypothetical protein EBZ48_17645 [Proteobacteria bacterium]|nr:hypothetical protein [Pseudomonadota bacterium]
MNAACRGELRSRRQRASEAEQQAREVLRREQERLHEVELKMQGIDHLLSSAAERIREEFQLEVEEAVQQGRSAIAVWLKQQSGEAAVEQAGGVQGAAEFDSSAAEVLQEGHWVVMGNLSPYDVDLMYIIRECMSPTRSSSTGTSLFIMTESNTKSRPKPLSIRDGWVRMFSSLAVTYFTYSVEVLEE